MQRTSILVGLARYFCAARIHLPPASMKFSRLLGICCILLTVSTFFDMTDSTLAQWFIENRGQVDATWRFVSIGGDVIATDSELLYSGDGTLRRIAVGGTHVEPEEQLPAFLNVYHAAEVFEGLRLWRRLVWRTPAGTIRAAVQWTPQGLLVERADGSAQLLRMHQSASTGTWLHGGRLLGSSGRDSLTQVQTHGESVYLAGWTASGSLFGSSNAGGGDAVCLKVSANGQLQWATLIGGTSEDVAFGLAVSPDRIAVVGRTRSANFPTTAGVIGPSYGGGDADGFIVTLDPSSGSRRAATYVGGDASDELRAVAFDSGGRIIAGGTTASATLPATAHQQQFGGLEDGYVITLDASLTRRIWSTYYGGRGFDGIWGVGTLADGSITIAGVTTSPNTGQAIAANIGEGSQRLTPPDGFLARLDANGQRLWGRYYGSDGTDTITSLSVTASGLILVTGFTNGTNSAASYFADAEAVQNQFAGGAWDGFVAVIRPDGTRLWGSYYGGSGADRCTGAQMDANGYVYVTGWTTSSDLPLKESENDALVGAEDVMVGMFSPDGSRRIASLLYGGSGSDFPCGIAWLADSTLAIAGSTSSATISNLEGQNAGDFDGFLFRIGGLGILHVGQERSFECAPIAVSGSTVRVELPAGCASAQLAMYTLTGAQIAEQRIEQDVSIPLPTGVYALRLWCGANREIRSAVVVP
jgi:hypothetical protein